MNKALISCFIRLNGNYQGYTFKERRFSQMDLHTICFWTNTIKDWKHLLKQNKYKQLIIDLLKAGRKINNYSLCLYIMPNHFHFVWRLNKLNGKENLMPALTRQQHISLSKTSYHP